MAGDLRTAESVDVGDIFTLVVDFDTLLAPPCGGSANVILADTAECAFSSTKLVFLRIGTRGFFVDMSSFKIMNLHWRKN